MDYRQNFYLVLIFDFLLLVLLGAISFRFLNLQMKTSQQVDPAILSQYTVSLELERLLELEKKLNN